MDNQKNMETVKQLYANVVAKNLERVFSSLTDDIQWAPSYVPEIAHTYYIG